MESNKIFKSVHDLLLLFLLPIEVAVPVGTSAQHNYTALRSEVVINLLSSASLIVLIGKL